MPSSTSSFERHLPDLPWLLIFGKALFIFLAFASLVEVRLAQLGYQPTTLDSKDRWAKERSRVDALGKKALILVGASRIQLGIDLDTLRRETKLEPVQLAIDGSSFIPVLRNLANDPSMRGTVIVDYSPGALEGALSGSYGAATTFVEAYEKQIGSHALFTLAQVEKHLAENIHESLRSYSDGANPLLSLQWRIIPNQRASNYLITLPDRSRLADYKLVPMPEFYYRRVARNLGEEKSLNIAAADAELVLRRKIDLLKAHDNTAYIQGARYLRQLVSQIESHGGKVLFIAMPTSGMVREIDEKVYPGASFLDQLKKEADISVLNSADDPTRQSFVCPDGSHLDFRDRAIFTTAITHVLNIAPQH
jgi:hypothetical protein